LLQIDVHCCKTGEVVVIHDDTVDRTTQGKGQVAELSWTELKKLRTSEGFKIPLLSEVLDIIDAKCVLNVELKGIGVAIPTIELLNSYIKKSKWNYENIILSSFDHSQLFQVKKITSAYRLGVLTEKMIPNILNVAQSLEAFSVHPPITSLTNQAVAQAKENGYKVYVWTVNKESDMAKLKDWQIDGMITDFPNKA